MCIKCEKYICTYVYNVCIIHLIFFLSVHYRVFSYMYGKRKYVRTYNTNIIQKITNNKNTKFTLAVFLVSCFMMGHIYEDVINLRLLRYSLHSLTDAPFPKSH